MKKMAGSRGRRKGIPILLLAVLLGALLLGGCGAAKKSETLPDSGTEADETGIAGGEAKETDTAGQAGEEPEAAQAGLLGGVQADLKTDPDKLTSEGTENNTASDAGTGTVSGTQTTEGAAGTEAGAAGNGSGAASGSSGSAKDTREKYAGDISVLDNTSQGWGQGVQFDDQNRPAGATSYQEKYGQYSADFIRMGEEESNRIYLTFDEGYENGYTSQILDVLKEKNCPAVFFVTMPYVKEEPELVRRMIDEGHIVGNHSVTHPSAGLPSQSREQQENELLELHQYVKDNFGYEMSLFRYPAGKFSEQSLAIVQSVDYTSVFWSFAYRDWDPDNQPDETEALAKLKERLHPGAIYLLHAVSRTNTNILGQFIDDARAAGYEFISYR